MSPISVENFFDQYLKQYFHLAVCTTLLTAFTYTSTSNPIDWLYAVWSGFVTFLLYKLRYLLYCNDSQIRSYLTTNAITIIFLIIVGSFGISRLHFMFTELPVLVIAFVLTVLYFRKTILNSHALRHNYILKPLIIGLVFAILTAYIPYVETGYTAWEAALLSIARWSYVSALALAFDIGDVQEDAAAPITTLPQKIGIKRSKIIASGLLMIAALTEAYGAWIYLIDFHCLIGLMATYFIAWLLIINSSPSKSAKYYLFLIDGTMVLPYIISFI
ncbi:MAG: UbiA prenyltransferase family protein [Saprospiraceae bacterium]|nr:UbiA prenyltransferase family protein [Saprospiraceae bacterium]